MEVDARKSIGSVSSFSRRITAMFCLANARAKMEPEGPIPAIIIGAAVFIVGS